MIATWICIGLAAVGLLAQLVARAQGKKRAEGALKTLTSALYVGVAALEARDANGYALWIGVGLGFSVLGDVLMIGPGRRWLAGGLVAFLLAHCSYLIACAPLVDLAYVHPFGFGVALAVILIAGTATLATVRPNLGRLRFPAYVYVAALGTMALVAVSAWLTAPTQTGYQLLGAAACLFFVSDISVALQRFNDAPFLTRVWGLTCYYAAQVLFALSIGRMAGW